MKTLFWISIIIIVYTFLGYGLILFFLVRLKRLLKGKKNLPVVHQDELPSCTLVVAAYNEEHFIEEKIANTLQLKYPEDKLKFVFVTDGSDDKTPDIIKRYPEITLLHQAERNGKIAAVHRAVKHVNTEVIVFTDANTYLNENALINICRHYSDQNVGAVAGEKRVMMDKKADASAAGEGFYWKYESVLKKWDSELYSVVGAAGELFSIRKTLYAPVSPDSILDDFMISMLIAKKGYRIIYEPDAYATETASENITEELKRKIRIAAGGIQSVLWLKSLLNFFKYGVLSFQYISHRVLRWTLTPFLILLVLLLNILIVTWDANTIYTILLLGQVLFYVLAITGLILEKHHLRIKILFIPYYFCIMNYAVLAGILRFYRNKQSASWEKAKRR